MNRSITIADTTNIDDLAVTTAKLASGAVTAAKIANSTITETQLATSIAGNGLSGGAGTPLSVGVDNSTIEISGDVLQAKAGGLTDTHINSEALVTRSKLAAPLTTSSSSISSSGLTSTSFATLASFTAGNTFRSGGYKILIYPFANSSIAHLGLTTSGSSAYIDLRLSVGGSVHAYTRIGGYSPSGSHYCPVPIILCESLAVAIVNASTTILLEYAVGSGTTATFTNTILTVVGY